MYRHPESNYVGIWSLSDSSSSVLTPTARSWAWFLQKPFYKPPWLPCSQLMRIDVTPVLSHLWGEHTQSGSRCAIGRGLHSLASETRPRPASDCQHDASWLLQGLLVAPEKVQMLCTKATLTLPRFLSTFAPTRAFRHKGPDCSLFRKSTLIHGFKLSWSPC